MIAPVAAQSQQNLPNNIFGLHINQPEEQDVKDVAALARSGGGDWGYITVTIPRNNKDVDKWNNYMNLLRRLHLIPIIRIATEGCGDSWCEPRQEDIKEWADFLDKLRWPVKRRYVICYNEVNRAGEWGGKIDPAAYAAHCKQQAEALKAKNNDFVIAMAGMDAAAPNQFPYMDEGVFLRQMLAAQPGFFDNIECISSHSYANHGFVGSPHANGRNSILNFQWELGVLKSLGVQKDLCVLITESGWPHAEGSSYRRGYHSVETLKGYYPIYYARVAADPRVIATTPFIYKDCGQFEHFSWYDCGSNTQWPFVEVVKSLPKVRGEPEQRMRFDLRGDLPKKVYTDSQYTLPVFFSNQGQAWLDTSDGYQLRPTEEDVLVSFGPVSDMQTTAVRSIPLMLSTGLFTGQNCFTAGMFKNDRKITDLFQWCYEVATAPSLEFQLGTLIRTQGPVKVEFFDAQNKSVFSAQIIVKDKGFIPALRNVLPGKTYRVVVSKEYHLPEEKELTIEAANRLQFGALAPVDVNNDGQFNFQDLVSIRENLMNKPSDQSTQE